eukprot:1157817-Pelagomonas_calceolata.AAC.7
MSPLLVHGWQERGQATPCPVNMPVVFTHPVQHCSLRFYVKKPMVGQLLRSFGLNVVPFPQPVYTGKDGYSRVPKAPR